MRNFVQNGDVLTLVAPAGGVVSGQFITVGGLHGFCVTDAAEGMPVSVAWRGVFTAPKAAVLVHQGDPLFFDPIAHVFTTVEGSDFCRALATEDAAQDAPDVVLIVVPPIASGGDGYDPDGTTIDLVADLLHVKDGVFAADAHVSQHASAGADPLAPSDIGASPVGHDHAASYAPLTHASRHATAGADPMAPADIGAATAGHSHDDLPSADEKDALAGTNGTPSSTNPYVTDSDPRLSGGGGPGVLAVFTGSNGAGPCSVPGATIGMSVEFVLNLTDATDDRAKFESTITVVDQIQQTDAGDLSAKHFFVIGG